MKKLTEKEVITLMREEWNRKVESLLKEKSEDSKEDHSSKKGKDSDVDLSVEVPVMGKREVVISPGLKVKSKKEAGGLQSGILYTVKKVDAKEKKIVLVHEKETGAVRRVVSWDEFSKEFQITNKKKSEGKK